MSRFFLLAETYVELETVPRGKFLWPYSVSICFEPGVLEPVVLEEGTGGFGQQGSSHTASHALQPICREHFLLAKGEWLLPYIASMAEGHIPSEDEVVARFVSMHGGQPISSGKPGVGARLACPTKRFEPPGSRMKPEIDDPVLGRLVHDGYYYNGKFDVPGHAGSFAVGTYQVEDVQSRIERAREIHSSLPVRIERAKEYAAAKLLELKNDKLPEADGRLVGAAEFLEKISITSVTLDHDAEVVMYFDDGDLFYDRDILITEKPDGTLDRAAIQGHRF